MEGEVEDNMVGLGLVMAQVLDMDKLVGMVLMEEVMLREVVRVEVAVADKMVGLDKVLALALDMVRLADMLRQVAKVVVAEAAKVVKMVVDMEVAQGVALEVLAVVIRRPSIWIWISNIHLY